MLRSCRNMNTSLLFEQQAKNCLQVYPGVAWVMIVTDSKDIFTCTHTDTACVSVRVWVCKMVWLRSGLVRV